MSEFSGTTSSSDPPWAGATVSLLEIGREEVLGKVVLSSVGVAFVAGGLRERQYGEVAGTGWDRHSQEWGLRERQDQGERLGGALIF